MCINTLWVSVKDISHYHPGLKVISRHRVFLAHSLIQLQQSRDWDMSSGAIHNSLSPYLLFEDLPLNHFVLGISDEHVKTLTQQLCIAQISWQT